MANSEKNRPRGERARPRSAANDARNDSPLEAAVTPLCHRIDQKQEAVL